MRVPIEIERSLDIPVAVTRARVLFDDVESAMRRFPKLRQIKRLGDDAWLWELETMGSRAAKVAVAISYAARYRIDPDAGRLVWTPLPRHGNASIAGAFELDGDGRRTNLKFRVEGELHDVPVPLVYRLLAPPFIQGKFQRLVDTFLERTRTALVSGKSA